MSDSDRLLSPALLAANRILLSRRQQVGVTAAVQEQATHRPIPPAEVANLPSHLGWGSARETAVYKAAYKTNDQKTAVIRVADQHPVTNPNYIEEAPFNSPATTIKIYPSIALGMLREEKTAVGRIWLLARHFDSTGSGKFRIAELRQLITTPSTLQRVCGWRQLRNLLREGESVFWQRDATHLWLFSAAKAAYALGVTRLTGRPVAVPVTALMGGIGVVRAHLYASFHSGRAKDDKRNGIEAMPIARETLTAVSGIGRTTQRKYEAQTQISVQQNYAIGASVSKETQEAAAWKRGAGVFTIKKKDGKNGRLEYLAWQLPNSYGSSHQKRPLGRQKRINRTLKDLVTQGMPGNVDDTNDAVVTKRYFGNGKLAADAHGQSKSDLYWHHKKEKNGRAFWYCI